MLLCASMAAKKGGVVLNISISNRFNLLHFPRVMTSIKTGALVRVGRDIMSMKFPTPEDCISSTARIPPSQVLTQITTPSCLGRENIYFQLFVQSEEVYQSGENRIGDIRHLTDIFII